ncbi:MAG: hypothetical protein ACKO37_08155 [Vampirovibrionales bacterium]
MMVQVMSSCLRSVKVKFNAFVACTLLALMGYSFSAWSHVEVWAVKPHTVAKTVPVKVVPMEVTTLALVSTPQQYLGKRVVFQGVFSGFSGLGLDYVFKTKDGKMQKKSSKEYVTLTMLRGDVTHHQIPLSELKIFANRGLSGQMEKVSQGDQLRIEGDVLSDALGDAWVEAKQIRILKAAPPKKH